MKVRISIVVSFLACLSLLIAIGGCRTKILIPAPDPAKLGTIEYDITYANVSDVALKMDIYYPESADKAVPALVYVHGGGWVSGDKASGIGIKLIPELVSRGYLVAAINYRLAPKYQFPAQIEDVKCAIKYLRANATDFGMDAERIGAFGDSAGGHLVALLGTSDESSGLEGSCVYVDQSSRVQAVVDLFGPADLTVEFEGAGAMILKEVFGTDDRNSKIVSQASPVTHVTGDDPPFLILHGDKDTLVPLSQSELLYNELIGAKVPATLVVVRKAAHGFRPEGGSINPPWNEIVETIIDFFDEHLK